MNTKFAFSKKGYLLITAIFSILSLNGYSQSYLPLTGGTLTGNLGLASGTQLQAPYYGFNAFSTQPSTSANLAIFPNSSTGTVDLVGQGWRFIPASSSSYPSAVAQIDVSGNAAFSGALNVGRNFSVTAGNATIY